MRIRWQGYRGYSDTGWVEFAPLTLLVGANNAGKTSLYSPLLLLQQTLETARPDTPLLSQGPMFDAGRFRDFAFGHDIHSEVKFSLGIPEESIQNRLHRFDKSELPHVLEVTFASDGETGTRTQLAGTRLLNKAGKNLVSRRRLKDGTFSMAGSLLPSETKIGRPPAQVSALRGAMRSESPEHFMFRGMGGMGGVSDLTEIRPDLQERVNSWLNAGIKLFQLQYAASTTITRLLNQISYVGPLRAMPQRTYQLSAEPPLDVGINGESAPELLFRDSIEGSGDLLSGVSKFLQSCGYGGIDFRPGADNESFELLLGPRGDAVWSNLVDSGMGISQLLPLITQSFGGGRSSLSILQQPEIHLNPALQVRLMDHLVSRVEHGHQVLVETHSEHLLLRLRRLIAEERLDPSDVAILYADKVGGDSVIRQIEITESGSIEMGEWPAGFFEEQMEDALLLARAQSRRARTR